MRKLFKKSLAVILVVIMAFTATPLSGFVGLDLPSLFSFKSEAASYSGTCGENLTWSLDTSTGVLEISGEGEMYDYNYEYNDVPWEKYRHKILDVVIADGVTSIGEFAFYYLPYLKSIEIPKNISSIGVAAFNYCESLSSITVNSENIAFSSDEYGVLFNKEKTILIQYPIGKAATHYEVPDSVTIIGPVSFLDCKNLTSIELSDNTTTIGSSAFLTSNLESVTFPDSITAIGEYAFACTPLKSVTIGDNVTSIGEAAFYLCNYLESVTIGDSVTYLGAQSFIGCEKLTHVIIPDSVKSIGMGAFYSCTNLEYIHIPKSVNEIGEELLSSDSLTFICSSTEDCYAKTYADANGIEFRICTDHDTDHKHTPKIITVPASCKVNGMEYTVCEECGEPIGEATIIPAAHKWDEWETVTEATCKVEGKRVKTCSACGETLEETIDKKEHIPGEWETVKEATCKEAGEKVQKCTVCGEVLDTEIIPQKEHIPGEWETVIEPTADTEGKRIKKCTVCDETLEEEVIPKLEISTAVDDKTGVEIEYVSNDYDGEVNIIVEQAFDGDAFDVVDTTLDSTQKHIYDITMTVNGIVTQPKGKVTVRIPLPEGYDHTRTFVYYINSNTGTVEPMYAEYSDGYMVFETTHFSYYALVEVLGVELKINKASTTTINFGDTLVLTLSEIEIPEGYTIEWFVESTGVSIQVSEDGKECRVTSIASGMADVTAHIFDENGEAVRDSDGKEISDSITLTSKAGFFQKVISFFKNLFRINRIIY